MQYSVPLRCTPRLDLSLSVAARTPTHVSGRIQEQCAETVLTLPGSGMSLLTY